MEKRKLLVVFGGESSEHEVSCISAATIIKEADRDRFDLVLVGITKEGDWLLVEEASSLSDGSWRKGTEHGYIVPGPGGGLLLREKDGALRKESVDVAFPVLHGSMGEDGTIQGLFEMAHLPYVGCGVLASALGMDKAYTKLVVDGLGIRQADYELVHSRELPPYMEEVLDRIEAKFSYPVFVKPCNAGSSLGVTKASFRLELKEGLLLAAAHDGKILVEETVRGREVECAVFGGGALGTKASGVGEVVSAGEFYDFESKYHASESKTVVNPSLPGEAAAKIPVFAEKIFDAIGGFGLSRVDFFVEEDGGIVFNEINTMPGFTSISMYPMLWEARGINKKALITALVEAAFVR